jgi:cell division protein FtsQ
VVNIRTAGNDIVTSEEIIRLAAIPKDSKLFDVDLYAAQKRVRDNTFMREVEVTRDVPDGITIEVVERLPIAALAAGGMLYVDDSGMVLPGVRSDRVFDLPMITGTLSDADRVPGTRLQSGGAREALHVILMAQRISDEFYHRISEVHIRPDQQLLLYTSEFAVPVVLGRENTAEKLVKFEGFWKDIVSHRGAQDLQYVDLRFTDQVVVRWK